MKINWRTHIHTGWRQACGIGFILVGIVGAAFYYIELYTIGKAITTTANANNAIITAKAQPVSSNPASPSATPSPKQTGTIKISTATQAELESLPKIGPAKAKAIIDYRTKHPFKSVNDLVKVKGIGPKTMEQLKPLIEL